MFKTLFLVLLSFQLNAHVEYWQVIDSTRNKQTLEKGFDIKPTHYQLLAFDTIGFHQYAQQNSLYLNLPMPDGEFIGFNFDAVDIMAPELAVKFPSIHTFRGTSVDGLSTAILDITHKGLHAVVSHGNKKIWIDPINRQTNREHISYYQSDLNKSNQSWQCHFKDEKSTIDQHSSIKGQLPINELTLKTYRLAVAATAEYTAYHSTGATNVADGMAAIVTAMNRVNGVYEVEMGIRMILIGNNDQIVFLDPATDGYTNNNGGAMLGQNQSIIDNIIGSANYDIGHVFSTGGGGIANYQAPCNVFKKAKGVTGSNQPINDYFYIDYVAHEMGHQWGAKHIFNTNAGFCGPNWVASTAVEPGSGSTIMGYAGLCSPDDLQNRSDDYFNSKSLQEMNNFAVNSTSSCVVNINTNNQAPVVDAGLNYTIPKSTPFKLCAQASDVDSANLTYNWEQTDLGPAGLSNNPVGDAPIFRSYTAISDNCRTFPKLANILNNTPGNGERLASYSRDLNFNITVRDNELNGGAINTDETLVSVTDDGPFKIVSHNNSQGVVSNLPTTISWDVSGTDQAPINCTSIDAYVSLDAGLNFINTTSGLPNTGSGMVNIPNANSNQLRIKLKCSDNIFFDINDANLFIVDDLIFDHGFE